VRIGIASSANMASPKSNKSSKKFTKTTHSQNLYKDNFDSGPALLNRLKEELSSITQDKVDPMTKSIQTSYLNKQLGEIYKRRQNCVDKERALTQKLKELLRNKVEEADEKVKLYVELTHSPSHGTKLDKLFDESSMNGFVGWRLSDTSDINLYDVYPEWKQEINTSLDNLSLGISSGFRESLQYQHSLDILSIQKRKNRIQKMSKSSPMSRPYHIYRNITCFQKNMSPFISLFSSQSD